MARLKQDHRVRVFLKAQDLCSEPAHRCSKFFSQLVISVSLARLVSGGIQLTTDEPWMAIKDYFRDIDLSSKPIPKILPPLPYYSNFASVYPPTPVGTWGKQHQEEIWMRAERF